VSRRGKVEDPNDPPETLEEFYEPPVGHWRFGAFPPDRFVVGMAFEVGGAYEDWGWIIYEKVFEGHYEKPAEERPGSHIPPRGPLYKLKPFCTARRLPDLLAKTDEKMRELSGR